MLAEIKTLDFLSSDMHVDSSVKKSQQNTQFWGHRDIQKTRVSIIHSFWAIRAYRYDIPWVKK